jgi:undecaprenyl-diphosphatase
MPGAVTTSPGNTTPEAAPAETPNTAARNLWPVLALLAGSALWLAGWLASELVEGETFGFDAAILTGLRRADDLAVPAGPAWLLQGAIDISAMGGATLLWLIGLAGTGFLALLGRRREALWLAATFAGSSLLNAGLKLLFDRDRPDLVPHLTVISDTSFPSGHAMNAAAVYLTLGILLAETQPRRAQRVFLLGIAVLMVVLIGCSRVYLGVHWPSDVIAGWCVGSVWALAAYRLNHRLLRRARD